ncbi:MAG: hypothetical protein ACI97N_000309 [Cognaticolwellia sp.]|jgi:hypothetical protein|tara:strand:+ start:695 stop:1240 length:546 start_codon:yes stop_codon:yes gene_type:complete
MKVKIILFSLFVLAISFSSCRTIEDPIITGEEQQESILQFDFEGEMPLVIDDCYDLTIKSLKILEKHKKEIIIEYTIFNKGSIAIPIEGTKRTKRDNIGIQIFFSGDDKYNRGDLLVDGIFIEKPENTEDGLIKPNDTYKAQIKINLKRKTSYHSTLILYIDPMQVFKECDETNNYTTVRF